MKTQRSIVQTLFGAVAAMFLASDASAEAMRLAVTTSFHNSGLADVLLPEILADTGIELQLLVVGTGQAIRLGQSGDVDAVFVHSRPAETAFVASGFGTHRREIMYNDFVLIGPKDDPAGITQAADAKGALSAIKSVPSPFVSRGDDSGTHKKELSLWADTGSEPDTFDNWYRNVGAGMGTALNIASGMQAYILADRASWLNFGNKGDLALLFSGDPALFNQYAYLPVNPVRHTHVKNELAQTVEAWLASEKARKLIDSYQIAGQRLFTFNAKP